MQGFEAMYFDIPPVTRGYATLVFILSFLTHIELVSPYHVYYVPDLALFQHQYWRLLTTFLFFGHLSIDFLFHMYFLIRYSRLLEETSYRTSPASYLFLLILGGITMLLITPLVLPAMSLPFLGPSLTFMLVYIWSRRNPYIPLNFMGLFVIMAPYLPWVLLAFSWLLNGSVPTADLVGIAVGHLFWWLEDVYPKTRDARGRLRGPVLRTPWILKRLIDPRQPDRPDPASEDEDDDHDSVGSSASEAARGTSPDRQQHQDPQRVRRRRSVSGEEGVPFQENGNDDVVRQRQPLVRPRQDDADADDDELSEEDLVAGASA